MYLCELICDICYFFCRSLEIVCLTFKSQERHFSLFIFLWKSFVPYFFSQLPKSICLMQFLLVVTICWKTYILLRFFNLMSYCITGMTLVRTNHPMFDVSDTHIRHFKLYLGTFFFFFFMQPYLWPCLCYVICLYQYLWLS